MIFKQSFNTLICKQNNVWKAENTTTRFKNIVYCLKNKQQVSKTWGKAESFKPDKTHATSFLNNFKNIPNKYRVPTEIKQMRCEKIRKTRKLEEEKNKKISIQEKQVS